MPYINSTEPMMSYSPKPFPQTMPRSSWVAGSLPSGRSTRGRLGWERWCMDSTL